MRSIVLKKKCNNNNNEEGSYKYDGFMSNFENNDAIYVFI